MSVILLMSQNLENLRVSFTQYSNFRNIIDVLQTAGRLQQHMPSKEDFALKKLYSLDLRGMDPDGGHCLNFGELRPILQMKSLHRFTSDRLDARRR